MPVDLKQSLCKVKATGRCHCQQTQAANFGVLSAFSHPPYFSRKRRLAVLKWWQSPKPQNLPPGASSSSSSLWVETPSQLHGKCVSLLFMAMNQQPFGTGCWLTAVETHWLHKENGFHLCSMKGSGGHTIVVMGWKVKENCPDPLLI